MSETDWRRAYEQRGLDIAELREKLAEARDDSEHNLACCKELREKLAAAKKLQDMTMHNQVQWMQKHTQVEQERDRLAAAEIKTVRCPKCKSTLIFKRLGEGEIEFYHNCPQDFRLVADERDRLRRALEWIKDQMYNEDFDADLVIARIDEALAQPAEKETT